MLSLADASAGHLSRILMLSLYCIYCMFYPPTYRYIIPVWEPLPRTHPYPTVGDGDAPRSFYCSAAAAPVWAAVWRAQAQGALNWDTMLRCSHYDATVPYYQYYDKYYATTVLRCCGAARRNTHGTARTVVAGHGAL